MRGGPYGATLYVRAQFDESIPVVLTPVDMGTYFEASWTGVTSATQLTFSVAGTSSDPADLEYLDVFFAEYRFTVADGGLWPLRQRQSLIGGGSWPLRQRQHGAHSGSWPLRQRQTGV